MSDTRLSMIYGIPSINSYNNPSSLDIIILVFRERKLRCEEVR